MTSPSDSEVLAAIEVVKAHLDADWISEGCNGHVLGCASCQAVSLKGQLDALAGFIAEDATPTPQGEAAQ